MATQLWVFTPNPLKSGTDILAHRSARSFGMRSGFVIAAPTPYGSGKLRVEEVQLAPEAFRTPEIIEAHGFRQFLVQLAKPASIVALGMLIERISRIAKVLGLEGPARDPGADNRRWNCPSLHLCNQLVNVESLAGMRQQMAM